MKLIKVDTLETHDFIDIDVAPPYAILSHRWGDEECTYQMMGTPQVVGRKGLWKVKQCCAQAFADGLGWAWVDSCCIDKTSSAELSEAINSMYRWYRHAKVCYVYLDDIHGVRAMGQSLWFTRGWTLQELVAPTDVAFYDASWTKLGTKQNLFRQIGDRTKIDTEILLSYNIDRSNFVERMAWAVGRTTSRREDIAYCLLGLFDVNMPLLYGEGNKAFLRLQQEILRTTRDYSLLAWGLPEEPQIFPRSTSLAPLELGTYELSGLLATSPNDFTNPQEIHRIWSWSKTLNPVAIGGDIEITLLLKKEEDLILAALPFWLTSHPGHYICLVLHDNEDGSYSRSKQLVLAPFDWYENDIYMVGPSLQRDNAERGGWSEQRIHVAVPDSKSRAPPLQSVDISGRRLQASMGGIEVLQIMCYSHVTYTNARSIYFHRLQEGPFALLIVGRSSAVIAGGDLEWVYQYRDTHGESDEMPGDNFRTRQRSALVLCLVRLRDQYVVRMFFIAEPSRGVMTNVPMLLMPHTHRNNDLNAIVRDGFGRDGFESDSMASDEAWRSRCSKEATLVIEMHAVVYHGHEDDTWYHRELSLVASINTDWKNPVASQFALHIQHKSVVSKEAQVPRRPSDAKEAVNTTAQTPKGIRALMFRKKAGQTR